MIRLSRMGVGSLAVAMILSTVRPAAAAEADKLLPASSEVVVYINVRQVVTSELMKKYALEQLKQSLAGNDAQKVLGILGLDPLKDLDRVVIGLHGDDPANLQALSIVRGKFDSNKINFEAAAKEYPDNASIVKEGDKSLIKLTLDKMPKPVYGAVAGPGVMVFSSEKDMVLEALAGGSKKPLNAGLAALITAIDERTTLSAAAVVDGKLGNIPIPDGVVDPSIQKNLEKTSSLTVNVNVTDELTIAIGFGMKDGEVADDFGKGVSQTVQQAKLLAPALLGNNPQFKFVIELSKTLSSTVKDKQVIISAKLDADSIGRLVNPE